MQFIDNRLYISHMREIFEKASIAELRSLMDQYYSEDALDLTPRELQLANQGVLPDKCRVDRRWYKLFSSKKANYHHIFFPFTHVTFPVVVRRVMDSSKHFVPWHQDFAYMKELPENRRHDQTLTCFVPLDVQPNKHTTLQFSSENQDHPLHLYRHDRFVQNYGLGINAEFKDVFTFNLDSGDALVFGDHAIHRTYNPPGNDIKRMSLEFRLVKSSSLLPGKDYYCLEDSKFIVA